MCFGRCSLLRISRIPSPLWRAARACNLLTIMLPQSQLLNSARASLCECAHMTISNAADVMRSEWHFIESQASLLRSRFKFGGGPIATTNQKFA